MKNEIEVQVKPNDYEYVTCTCGNPLMVWTKEPVHHVPFTDKCSRYIGVDKKTDESQLSLLDT